MTLATINAVWIGSRLGAMHAACLRSFVRHGHRTVLHVYSQPHDVPDGVELADAGELLPESRMMRHSQSGSLALFSDFLRYEILQQGLGLYVDCDAFCLGPIEDADQVFGFESRNCVTTSVLKLPTGSPVLDSLSAIKDERAFIPPWMGSKRKRRYRRRARLGMPVKIQDMPWGTTGPQALTWYVKEYGLERYAAPIDTFYPVHYYQTPLLLDPGLAIEDITTPRTRLLHLWSQKLKDVDFSRVTSSSPLGTILSS